MSEKSLHTGDTTPESEFEEVFSGDDLENAASLGTAESFDPDDQLAVPVPPVEPQRRRIVPERIHPNPIVEACLRDQVLNAYQQQTLHLPAD